MRPVLINFADRNFSQSQTLQTHNFKKLHPEGRVFEYYPENLEKFKNPATKPILNAPRGHGYWMWKYLLIEDYLRNKARKGDVVIYLDSGILPIRRLDSMLSFDGSINLFKCQTPQLPFSELTLGKWCKKDVLEYMSDSPDELELLRNTPTLSAGFQVYKNTQESQDFLFRMTGKLLPWLWNDNPSTVPNYPEFVEHRHDQALLTIEAIDAGIDLKFAPTQESLQSGDVTEPEVSLILHRSRNGNTERLFPLVLDRVRPRV